MKLRALLILGGVGTAVYLVATTRGNQQVQRLRTQAATLAEGDGYTRPSTWAAKVKSTVAGLRPGRAGDAAGGTPHPGSASAADDVALARQVERTLALNPHITPGRVLVSAEGGRITLRGTTDAAADIAQLEQTARGVPGVTAVENLLHLPGSPAPTQHRAGMAAESVDQAILSGNA